MDKELKEYLWDGEVIRWSGRAEPFPLLERPVRGQILRRWACAAACACALLGIYGVISGAPGGKFAALVTLAAALVIAAPWLERRSVMGQMYFITNWRAILLTGDKCLYYMELDKVDEMRRVSLRPKVDALVLGGAIFEDARRRLRWRACRPKTDLQSPEGQDQAEGLIFYGIRDADIAEMLIRRRLTAETA